MHNFTGFMWLPDLMMGFSSIHSSSSKHAALCKCSFMITSLVMLNLKLCTLCQHSKPISVIFLHWNQWSRKALSSSIVKWLNLYTYQHIVLLNQNCRVHLQSPAISSITWWCSHEWMYLTQQGPVVPSSRLLLITASARHVNVNWLSMAASTAGLSPPLTTAVTVMFTS